MKFFVKKIGEVNIWVWIVIAIFAMIFIGIGMYFLSNSFNEGNFYFNQGNYENIGGENSLNQKNPQNNEGENSFFNEENSILPPPLPS